MARLCFVTTCMGRLAHLQLTLAKVVAQRDSSCVVVDYSCPERCGEWVEANYPQVRVVRVPGKTTFNRSPAANAGSRAVNAPWICFFDCDILFESSFAEKVLPLLQPGHYYGPYPIRDLGTYGTFICSREDFERVGGYDEVYEGWGQRDLDLYHALEFAGVKRRVFSSSLLRHIPHDDESRTKFHDIKKLRINHSTNAIYRLAKFDVMQLTGGVLSLQMRQRLYEEAAEMTKLIVHKGTSSHLNVQIIGLDFSLAYQIHARKGRRFQRFITKVHGLIKYALLRKERPARDPLTRILYGRRLPLGGRLSSPVVARHSERN